MTEDNFSEAFADFYVENVNQYGDSDEGLELAYSDFLEINGMDDEGLNEEIDAFSEFYSEMEDVYGDTEEGIEEAYADFLEIMNAEQGEEEDEFSELEEDFISYYTELADVYGDTEEGIEEAYADFMEAVEEEGLYEDESLYSQEDFNTDEEILEEFADFYADSEDIYGDDVEAAFDDYSDALEALAEEDEYASYSTRGALFTGGLGAGVGVASGAGLGALAGTIKRRSERHKDLILKNKIGTLTKAEVEELAILNSVRSKDIKRKAKIGALIGTGVGAVAGGGLGYGSKKLLDRHNSEDDYDDDEKKMRGFRSAMTGKNAKIAYASIGGSALGGGAAFMATKKLRDKISYLKSKGNKLTDADARELKSLKIKLAAIIGGASAVGGAASGYGAYRYMSRDEYADDDEKKMRGFRSAMTGKNAKIAYASIGGSALGGGAAFMATKKLRDKISYLKSKGNKLTDADARELKSLKIKLAAIIGGASAVGGAASGYGAYRYMSRDEYADEDRYDEGGSRLGNMKAGLSKLAGTNTGRAAIGGVAGLATGVAIGAMTDKNSAERKALKAKVKAGTATQAEQDRLKNLQTDRRNRLLKAGAAGTIVGAGAGFASKGIGAAGKQMKFNQEYNKSASDKKDKVSIFDGVGKEFKKEYPKKQNVAVNSASSYFIETENDRNFSLLDEYPNNRKSVNDAGTYVAKLIKS